MMLVKFIRLPKCLSADHYVKKHGSRTSAKHKHIVWHPKQLMCCKICSQSCGLRKTYIMIGGLILK